MSLMAPSIHQMALRGYVSRKVAMITAESRLSKPYQGGGTGFQVTANSGKSYMLTNRHVCNLSKDGTLWARISGFTDEHRLKILDNSRDFDLCLLEPIPGVSGLSLGNNPAIGETIYYVGHPRLQPRTFASGEFSGFDMITVEDGIIGKHIQEKQCKSKDSFIIEMPESLQVLRQITSGSNEGIEGAASLGSLINSTRKVRVCFHKNKGMTTTMMIYAGASGSPIVNSFGQLCGVVYAAPRIGGWGYGVTMADVKTILQGR